MSAVPLSEFKAHVNVSGSTDDLELQRTLDAAERWVGKFLGATLGEATRTVVRTAPAAMVFLPRIGLNGVMSVTTYDGVSVRGFGQAPFGGQSTAASGSEYVYRLDAEAGVVYLPQVSEYPWTVVATYDATVPADIKLAVLIIAAHLWETQRGQAPSPLDLQDGDISEPISGAGYAVPNRALALLEPYRTPAVA